MTDMYLTRHSKIRFEERTDYNRNNLQVITEQAFKKGLEMSNFKDPLFSFLKELCHGSDGRYVAKIYDNHVFIFNNSNGHRLLTVYTVPEKFLPIEKYKIEQKEIHPCILVLTKIGDTTEKAQFWSEFGLTDDIGEALEFKTQVKAQNYINNNKQLNTLLRNYIVEII